MTTAQGLLTVGEVARELGVTVRTLHHYDQRGLVTPSERSFAGYRLYTESDLDRLQQVVVYRRLGFSLEEIQQLLDAEPDGVAGHLRRQRAVVMSRLEELTGLVDAIDHALEAHMNNLPATSQDRRALFGDSFEEWQAEAEATWGDTDAYRESRSRTKNFTKEDYEAVKAEGERINALLVAAMEAGSATDEQAMDAAEAHRAGIERFYGCSYEMHRSLAQMYLQDERFHRYYEDIRPGLAQFTHDAIIANAQRHGA